MRARLVGAWPRLSKEFGLHPWDVRRLSVPELRSYLDAVADMDLAAKRAAAQRRRRG